MKDSLLSGDGGFSTMKTLYASMCGALMLIAALIPPAILIIEKAGF
jgi:hypothetical protein